MDPEQLPLRDLHLPEAVSWWPLAPGWWILLALLLVVLAIVAHNWLRAYRRNRARRVAHERFREYRAAYAEHGNPVALGRQLSELLRRTMLAYAPRASVAGLTGEAWLEWLDSGLDQPLFADGPGRVLIDLPYRDPDGSLDDVNVEGLVDAVETRILKPLVETS